jgi:hypothetical protein
MRAGVLRCLGKPVNCVVRHPTSGFFRFLQGHKKLAAGLVVGTLLGAGAIAYLGIFPALFQPTPGAEYVDQNHLSPDLHATVAVAIDKDHAMTADEKAFVDSMSSMDDASQHAVVDGLAGDGVITRDDADQAQFLAGLQSGERADLIKNGKVADTDIDKDGFKNLFEQKTSDTPYNVKNDRYVLLLTLAGREFKPTDEMHKIVKDMKIPENNIYSLNLNDNTPGNFESAVNDIAKRSDKNDTVFINIGGHGIKDAFTFYNGKTVGYDWIDKLLDKIESKMIFITVDSCKSGSAIKYLEGENRIVLTTNNEEETNGPKLFNEFLKAISSSSADRNENNHVSVGEAAEYVKEKNTIVDLKEPTNPLKNQTPQLSDRNNIGANIYLADIEV